MVCREKVKLVVQLVECAAHSHGATTPGANWDFASVSSTLAMGDCGYALSSLREHFAIFGLSCLPSGPRGELCGGGVALCRSVSCLCFVEVRGHCAVFVDDCAYSHLSPNPKRGYGSLSGSLSLSL